MQPLRIDMISAKGLHGLPIWSRLGLFSDPFLRNLAAKQADSTRAPIPLLAEHEGSSSRPQDDMDCRSAEVKGLGTTLGDLWTTLAPLSQSFIGNLTDKQADSARALPISGTWELLLRSPALWIMKVHRHYLTSQDGMGCRSGEVKAGTLRAHPASVK